MDDAPNIVIAIIINVIFYIVVPLIMIYRRGYFINFSERLEWIKNILNRKNAYLPEEWTIIKIRPLSAFEKYQIQKVVVKFMPESRDGYWTDIILKSGKHRLFKLGENKGYWIDDIIHKDNILLRTWQKSTQHKYDISIIISGMSKFNNQ